MVTIFATGVGQAKAVPINTPYGTYQSAGIDPVPDSGGALAAVKWRMPNLLGSGPLPFRLGGYWQPPPTNFIYRGQ